MAQQAQEPPQKPQIVISTQGLDGTMEQLRKELNISRLLNGQMALEKIDQVLLTIESILATQEQLGGRVSALEQQIKEKEERKEQILSERKQLGPQPIPQNLKKTKNVNFAIPATKENTTISANRNQSKISFKLIATGLITALAWWLWIHTHQK